MAFLFEHGLAQTGPRGSWHALEPDPPSPAPMPSPFTSGHTHLTCLSLPPRHGPVEGFRSLNKRSSTELLSGTHSLCRSRPGYSLLSRAGAAWLPGCLAGHLVFFWRHRTSLNWFRSYEQMRCTKRSEWEPAAPESWSRPCHRITISKPLFKLRHLRTVHARCLCRSSLMQRRGQSDRCMRRGMHGQHGTARASNMARHAQTARHARTVRHGATLHAHAARLCG